MFDLTNKENIQKTRGTITPIVDIVKLRAAKYSNERPQGQKWENVILLIQEILYNYSSTEWRIIFRTPHKSP